MVIKRWQPTRAVQAFGLAASLLVAPLAQAQSMPGGGSGGYGGSGSGSGSGSGLSEEEIESYQAQARAAQQAASAGFQAAWDAILASIPSTDPLFNPWHFDSKEKVDEMLEDVSWNNLLGGASNYASITMLVVTLGNSVCQIADSAMLGEHSFWMANVLDTPYEAGGPWATWNNFKITDGLFRAEHVQACTNVFVKVADVIDAVFGVWSSCATLALVVNPKGCTDAIANLKQKVKELAHELHKYLSTWPAKFIPNYITLGHQTHYIANLHPRCEAGSGKMSSSYNSVDGVHVTEGSVDPSNQGSDDPDDKDASLDNPVILNRPTVPKFTNLVRTPDPFAPNDRDADSETKIISQTMAFYYGQAPIDGYPYSMVLSPAEYCGQYISVPGLFNVGTGGSCTSGAGFLLKDRRGLTTSTAGDLTAKVMYSVYQSGFAPAGWKQFQDRCSANSQSMLQECRESALGANDYKCRDIVHQTGGGGGFGGGFGGGY